MYKLCEFYFSVENYIEVVFMFFRRVDDLKVSNDLNDDMFFIWDFRNFFWIM